MAIMMGEHLTLRIRIGFDGQAACCKLGKPLGLGKALRMFCLRALDLLCLGVAVELQRPALAQIAAFPPRSLGPQPRTGSAPAHDARDLSEGLHHRRIDCHLPRTVIDDDTGLQHGHDSGTPTATHPVSERVSQGLTATGRCWKNHDHSSCRASRSVSAAKGRNSLKGPIPPDQTNRQQAIWLQKARAVLPGRTQSAEFRLEIKQTPAGRAERFEPFQH